MELFLTRRLPEPQGCVFNRRVRCRCHVGYPEAEMDAWEGAFSWQAYALEGRPDLLNYLYQGDATWEQVWQLYRERPAPAEAVLRVTGLFHAMMSSRY